jgi:hypothetical protein
MQLAGISAPMEPFQRLRKRAPDLFESRIAQEFIGKNVAPTVGASLLTIRSADSTDFTFAHVQA